MEGKTFTEISMAHGIRECDISIAVRNERGRIKPVGTKTVETCNRPLKTWNENEVVEAVAKLWQRRADNYNARANIWESKAQRLTQELKA